MARSWYCSLHSQTSVPWYTWRNSNWWSWKDAYSTVLCEGSNCWEIPLTFSDNSLVKEFSRKVMTYSRNRRTIQAVNLPDGMDDQLYSSQIFSGYWNSGSCGGSTQMLIEMVLNLGAVVLNCRDLSVYFNQRDPPRFIWWSLQLEERVDEVCKAQSHICWISMHLPLLQGNSHWSNYRCSVNSIWTIITILGSSFC